MKLPPRWSQNRKRTSINFVPARRRPDCVKLLFTTWLLKQKVGVLYPGEGTSRLTNLLNPVVRIILHTPNPDSIRFDTFDSPQEKPTRASSGLCVSQIPRVRRPASA